MEWHLFSEKKPENGDIFVAVGSYGSMGLCHYIVYDRLNITNIEECDAKSIKKQQALFEKAKKKPYKFFGRGDVSEEDLLLSGGGHLIVYWAKVTTDGIDKEKLLGPGMKMPPENPKASDQVP